jgi:hypothetical protein
MIAVSWFTAAVSASILDSRDMVDTPFQRVGFNGDAIFNERLDKFAQDFGVTPELFCLDAERFVNLGADPLVQILGFQL